MKVNPKTQKSQENSIQYNQIDTQLETNHTHVVSIPGSNFKPNNSVLVAGFPSPGMIGSIVCNQLIEQLKLHQIAYIHSKYITPGVIWIGGRLRHPFRVYSNQDNSVLVLICDVPVAVEGIDSLSAAITGWCQENKVNTLFTVSGIYPDNMNPFPTNLTIRKAFVIENDANLKSTNSDDSKFDRNELPNFAFLGGLPGQILANSVVNFTHCAAVLVPTFSFIPDPEGAALVIEVLGNLIPKARVSSLELREEAEKVKARLLDLGKLQHRLMRNELPEKTAHEDTEDMYK